MLPGVRSCIMISKLLFFFFFFPWVVVVDAKLAVFSGYSRLKAIVVVLAASAISGGLEALFILTLRVCLVP